MSLDGISLLSVEGRSVPPRLVGYLPQKARLFYGTLYENITDSCANPPDRDHLAELITLLGLGDRLVPLLDTQAGEVSLGVHRAAMLVRLLLHQPRVLLLDEPLSDVSMADEVWLLETIGRLKAWSHVLFVTHNKQHAQQVAGNVVLLSGGTLIERADAEQFFAAPETALARQFLQSGSAWPAKPEDKSIVAPSHPAPAAPGNLGLRWVLPRRLGGMHQPGLLSDIDADFRVLSRLGVSRLVTLTERPLALAGVDTRSIVVDHFPIADMGAPDREACLQFLLRLSGDYDAGDSVVFHCRGGLGRTGLMLACFLIVHRDIGGKEAIDLVRKVNPNYIQSDSQFAFVQTLALESGAAGDTCRR